MSKEQEIQKILSEMSRREDFTEECATQELLSLRNLELIEILENVRRMKKYHKEFECSGAHGGKGCYESFCEDQSCRNAPEQYNQAVSEVESLISTMLEPNE